MSLIQLLHMHHKYHTNLNPEMIPPVCQSMDNTDCPPLRKQEERAEPQGGSSDPDTPSPGPLTRTPLHPPPQSAACSSCWRAVGIRSKWLDCSQTYSSQSPLLHWSQNSDFLNCQNLCKWRQCNFKIDWSFSQGGRVLFIFILQHCWIPDWDSSQ